MHIMFDFFFQMTDSFGENISVSLIENNTLTAVFERHLHQMPIGRIIIFCILMPIIVFFGIFGNIMTLVFLFKEKDTCTSSIYIKHLAVADLLTLVSRGALVLSIWWQIFWPEKYLSWKINSASIYIFSTFAEKISKCITVVIVFDRVVAVKCPFKYKDICTRKKATIAISVIYVVLMFMSFPAVVDIFAYFQANEENLTTSGYRTFESESNQYVMSRLLKSDKLLVLKMITRVFEFALILITLVGNFVIVLGMRKGNSVHQTSDNAGEQRIRKHRQITRMCLIISFTFLSLCGPFDIWSFLVLTGMIQMSTSSKYSLNIFGTLSTLNSAVNFVIYALMHTKYRKAYLAFLPCIRSTGIEVNPGVQGGNLQVRRDDDRSAANDASLETCV